MNRKSEKYRDLYLNNEHLKHNLKRKAVRGAGFTILSQIVNYGIQIVGAIILARILVPGDFGLIAMVTAFSMLLQNFGVNGFTEVIIQKEDLNQKQLSTFFWINIGMSAALMVFFMAASPLIALFYNEPRLKYVTIAMGSSIIFGGLSTHHMALLKRNLNFFRTSIIQIIAAIGSVSFGITLALSGAGYWALVVRRLSIPGITALIAWILCSWRPGLPFRGAKVKPMVLFALRTYGNFCLTYFRRNIDKVLLGRFHGSLALGNYDRAYHFSSMLPNQVTIPLTNVAIATLSRLRDQPEKFRHYFYYVFGIIGFVGMLCSSVLTIAGKDMILMLLGDQWKKAGDIFSAFAPGIGMILLYNTQQWLHFSLGRADRLLRWGSIALVATLTSYFIGLPFGGLGVAIAYSCNFYILLWPAIWYAGKPIGISSMSCFRIVWRYIVAGIVACVGTWALLYMSAPVSPFFLGKPIIIRIIISSMGVILIYCIIVFLLYRGFSPYIQLFRLVKELRPIKKSK